MMSLISALFCWYNYVPRFITTLLHYDFVISSIEWDYNEIKKKKKLTKIINENFTFILINI